MVWPPGSSCSPLDAPQWLVQDVLDHGLSGSMESLDTHASVAVAPHLIVLAYLEWAFQLYRTGVVSLHAAWHNVTPASVRSYVHDLVSKRTLTDCSTSTRLYPHACMHITSQVREWAASIPLRISCSSSSSSNSSAAATGTATCDVDIRWTKHAFQHSRTITTPSTHISSTIFSVMESSVFCDDVDAM
jgi:hypothetical protein